MFKEPFDCVIMTSVTQQRVARESSYIDNIESGEIEEKSQISYFRLVCIYFCAIVLLIFLFLYGKYNVQELHVIDDIVKLILNGTRVDEIA